MKIKAQFKKEGFRGFIKIGKLFYNKRFDEVPPKPGIYLVLISENKKPRFFRKSKGGWFKRDPTVVISKLRKKWIQERGILYIGKASSTSKTNLHKRIKSYIQFGSGKASPHRGGRYIWQLRGFNQLEICWKVISDKDPSIEESRYIEDFRKNHQGRLPFANLRRERRK